MTYDIPLAAVSQLKDALQSNAASWDTGIELNANAGSAAAYRQAGQHLVRMVRVEATHDVAYKMVLDAGVTVTFQMLHMLALTSKAQVQSVQELARRSKARDTYQLLTKIASTRLDIARPIEIELGMRASISSRITDHLQHYKVTDRGFTVDLAALVEETGIDMLMPTEMAPGQLPLGECPAPALGLVRSILEAATDISLVDNRLFAATLTGSPQQVNR